jgi:hypothetical protein
VNGSVIPDRWALRPFIDQYRGKQMKISLMKLYFGTSVGHHAENWRMLNAAEGYGRSALPDWHTVQLCAL